MACIPVPNYNEYTGDGVTTIYNFTFPYVEASDVEVRLGTYPNWVDLPQTEYYVDPGNPTILVFNSPPSGVFRIYRCTDAESLPATFQPGSAIRASDLNDNFETMLYIVQDANVKSEESQDSADDAYDRSIEALDTANEALDTANEAKQIAQDASDKVDDALEAISEVLNYTIIPNVPAINTTFPNPDTGDAAKILDSTGIENYSPLTGVPAGFVGDPGLNVSISWSTGNNTWVWQAVAPNNPDARYVRNDGPADTYLIYYNGQWVDGDAHYDARYDARYLTNDFRTLPVLP